MTAPKPLMTMGSLVEAMGDLAAAVADLEAFRDTSADLEPQAQADAIALVKDLRQRLGLVEADLSTTLGRAEGNHQGYLSDGRMFTLKRSPDRKAWNHDDWKRDVRRTIVRHTTDEMGSTIQVLTEDGEVQDFDLGRLLHLAITEAQEVHGSTAPRTTALKRLNLYATDYCESSPGGWLLNAVKPTDTTTEKDTNTDA